MIMRDVNSGWLVRYTHANVASFFFIFVYALFYMNGSVLRYLMKKFYINPFFLLVKGLWAKINFITVPEAINIGNGCIYSSSLQHSKERLIEILNELNHLIKNTVIPPYNGNLSSISEGQQEEHQQFLQWFVGFSDAEGSFLINTKNNKEVHFIFKITLHIDDISVLYTIKNKLVIGVVSIDGKYGSFRVNSFSVILEKLIPIFDKYSLLTLKQLNFKDWKKAVFLKYNSIKNGRSINPDDFSKILNLKNNMNSLRRDEVTNYENYIININMLSKYWLLGFVEGDGTFYFSNNSAVFGITQKDKKILELIAIFINNMKRPLLDPLLENTLIINKPNSIIKNNKGAYQLVITDTDILFQYIYPFFNELPFLSRKGVDFKIWCLGLIIISYGYHNLAPGKELLKKLYLNMNSKRYNTSSTTKNQSVLDVIKFEEIENVFKYDPPYDILSGKSHFILAKEYALTKGSRKGYKIYIYKYGIEIEGSPFNSYRAGGNAIGLSSVSSIKNYIDTDKIFKDGYTFYSKALQHKTPFFEE